MRKLPTISDDFRTKSMSPGSVTSQFVLVGEHEPAANITPGPRMPAAQVPFQIILGGIRATTLFAHENHVCNRRTGCYLTLCFPERGRKLPLASELQGRRVCVCVRIGVWVFKQIYYKHHHTHNAQHVVSGLFFTKMSYDN